MTQYQTMESIGETRAYMKSGINRVKNKISCYESTQIYRVVEVWSDGSDLLLLKIRGEQKKRKKGKGTLLKCTEAKA